MISLQGTHFFRYKDNYITLYIWQDAIMFEKNNMILLYIVLNSQHLEYYSSVKSVNVFRFSLV